MAAGKVVAEFIVKGLKKMQSSFAKIGRVAKRVAGIIRNLALQAIAFTVAVIAMTSKLAVLGGKVLQMERSFDGLTSSAGETSEVFLGKLRQAVNGTISDMNLMKAANLGILLGLPATADQMAELADVAQRLGRAVGRDTVSSFNDLIQGIGRQSRLILDNLGIVVQASKAYEVYAKRIGKSTSSLSEQETKLAFYEEALRQARAKVAEMGDEQLEASDFVQQATAAFENLRNEIAKMIAQSPVLISLIKTVRDRFVQWMTFIQNNSGQVQAFIDNVIRGVGELITLVLDLTPPLTKLISFIVENASIVLRVLGALSGAAIGFMVGGPIGAAIGAVGGAFAPELIQIGGNIAGGPQASAGQISNFEINITNEIKGVDMGSKGKLRRAGDTLGEAMARQIFRANHGRVVGSEIRAATVLG